MPQRTRRTGLLAAILTLFVAGARAVQVACTATDAANGEQYDLSSLMRTSGDDWVAKDTGEANEYIYRINVCHSLLFAPTNYTIFADTGAHQQRVDNPMAEYVIGRIASPNVTDGILTLTYENGEMCRSTQTARKTIITFACDPDGGIGEPVYTTENGCVYAFVWKSSAACPQKGASGAAIFLIVLLVLVSLYLLLGIAYNRFVAGKRGMHQLPNYPFWAAVASALKCWPDAKVVQYRQLPRSAAHADDLNPDEFDDDAVEQGEEHV